MTKPNSPVWTLGGSAVGRVWDNGHRLPMSTVVEIDVYEEVGTDDHPDPNAGSLRLVQSVDRLTDDLIQELLELLIGVEGIRPTGIPSDAREVSVPLLAPTVTDDQLEWTISEHLSLVHADRHDMYVVLADDCPGTSTEPHVELSAPHVWLLVQALTTIRCWQFDLETHFSAAATQRRTALRPGRLPRLGGRFRAVCRFRRLTHHRR